MGKNIAVFFGGKSPEHDVSIITALVSVIPPLKLLGHHVLPVYIAKNGDWFSAPELADIKTYQTGAIDKIIASAKPLKITMNGGLKIYQPAKLGREREFAVDVEFPALHGANGEDGSLMGLFRMANVPFVGCDMEAAVVAMNKTLAKIVAEKAGILTPKFLSFRAAELNDNPEGMIEKIARELHFPLFVKPPHLGSSIGISRVKNRAELLNALEVAAHYDREILVEEAVANLIEITVPVVGESDSPEPSLPERPLTADDNFFDFDTKYLKGGKKGGAKNPSAKSGAQGYSEIPAKIAPKLYDECLSVAKKVYSALGLSGISRVDLLVDAKAAKVYFNEVNPLPGSLYAHNFAKNGVSNVDLVAKLLDLAEQDFAARNKVATTFETNFLKQF